MVEDLVSALKLSQTPSDKTLQWLQEADDAIHEKLSAAGLVGERRSTRLAAFVNEYIKGRTDLKPRTITKFNATKEYLFDHFGADCDIRKVTEADGQAFRIYVLSQKNGKGQGMAENTVRKHTDCQAVFQPCDSSQDFACESTSRVAVYGCPKQGADALHHS